MIFVRNFKLTTGAGKIFPIKKDVFERESLQKMPYYGVNSKGKPIQLAVCPQCDNPIEIIGLYKRLKNTDRPYGRHYPHSVGGLAQYNQQSYEYCPYSKKHSTISPSDRKRKLTGFEKNIYNLMRDQFDRVIYVLSKELDIKITLGASRKMLETYISMEGWLYPWATINNLPWVFGHLSLSKSLYGHAILNGSQLHAAIERLCPSAEFVPSDKYNGYDVLTHKTGKWSDIRYCIIEHRRSTQGDTVRETMRLIVTSNDGEREKQIFNKELVINEEYFPNLLNLSPEKSRRNTKLLEIAARLMETKS